jgi:hypothetical protein
VHDQRYTPRKVTLSSGVVREFQLCRTDRDLEVWTWLDGHRAVPVMLPHRFRRWGPDEWQDELSCALRNAADSAFVG